MHPDKRLRSAAKAVLVHLRGDLNALTAASLATAAMVCVASPVQAQDVQFDIPAQPLDGALRAFSKQTGLQMLYSPEAIEGVTSHPVRGQMSAAAAVGELLKGTQLAYEISGSTVSLRQVSSTMRKIRVEDSTVDATTEGSGSYAGSGTTLMKGAQSLKDVPQSITVITRARIDDQRLDTVYDVLANTTGITLVNRPNGGSDIYSRGFYTNTIQYDGVPLQRSSSTGNHFNGMSVFLDRVEVLRGAQGLLEGSGNPGGSVNLVRKRGLAEPTFNAEARAGSWNNFGTRLEAGAALDGEGRLRSRALLDYEDKDSFIDTLSERNLNAYGALDFDLTSNTTLGVGVAHVRLEGPRYTNYGLPRYQDGSALDISRDTFVGADWNDSWRRETQAFVDLEHRFSPDWKLKIAGAYIDENWDALMAFGGYMMIPLDSSTIEGHGYTFDMSADNVGVDAYLSGSFQALGRTHELTFGANYSQQQRDDHYDEYWAYTSFDVFDTDHNAPGLETSTPNGLWLFSGEEVQKGVYGVLRSHVTDDLTLIAGARGSWYDYSSRVQTLTRTTFNRRDENGEITPYAGAVYALTPRWSVYASYTDIFQPQSATNAQLQVLDPIVGSNYEVGIKGEILDGALLTSLAVFRIDQENRNIPDLDAPLVCGSNGRSRCSRAAGEVRSEGYELEANGQVAQGWQLSAGYTYNRNEYLADNNPALIGTQFDYNTPKHILRFWSNWQLPNALSQWELGAGVNYRSEQRMNSTTRLNPVQGGYALWNARLGYQISEQWSASLNVDNLFDKRYYSFIANDYIFNYFGEPRSVLLTVRSKF